MQFQKRHPRIHDGSGSFSSQKVASARHPDVRCARVRTNPRSEESVRKPRSGAYLSARAKKSGGPQTLNPRHRARVARKHEKSLFPTFRGRARAQRRSINSAFYRRSSSAPRAFHRRHPRLDPCGIARARETNVKRGVFEASRAHRMP